MEKIKPQSISKSLNIINDLNSVWNLSYKIVVFPNDSATLQ